MCEWTPSLDLPSARSSLCPLSPVCASLEVLFVTKYVLPFAHTEPFLKLLQTGSVPACMQRTHGKLYRQTDRQTDRHTHTHTHTQSMECHAVESRDEVSDTESTTTKNSHKHNSTRPKTMQFSVTASIHSTHTTHIRILMWCCTHAENGRVWPGPFYTIHSTLEPPEHSNSVFQLVSLPLLYQAL